MSTSETPVRYLGIDPGLTKTGYAVLEATGNKIHLREGGLIRSTQDRELGERVREIHRGLAEVIEEHHPKAAAIEQVFSSGVNPKTAILMAHARGGLLLALADAEVPVLHYTPRQVKKLLTGSGKASKEQMQHAVKTELGLDDVLKPNDVADATAMAICLAHALKFA